MQRLVFSTESVPEREQFEFWRDLGSRYFLAVRWERDGPAGAPYRGAMTVRQVGEARFIDLRCEGHRVETGRAAAARVAADVFIIEQEIGGSPRYDIGPRRIDCRPGDFLVHSPEARFEENGPDNWATRIWVVPGRRIAPLLPAGSQSSLHIPHRDGAVALAAAAAQGLAEQADRLEPAAADAVMDNFCRLLAIAAGAIEGGREALRAAALGRAKRYVDRHLADPDLTPAGVARAVGLSERQLQRLFERTGESLARYVLRRRLEEVRAALDRPGARQVTELALAWGFGSLPSFYRGFGRAYGAAPGEVRAALAGTN
jgi:AraC-like DNA-binding protein